MRARKLSLLFLPSAFSVILGYLVLFPLTAIGNCDTAHILVKLVGEPQLFQYHY